MRDYNVKTERIANRLIPHFVRKPVHKAYMYALLKPIETLNRLLTELVITTRIEASLTSQTMLFEDYLNRAFRGEFASEEENIKIIHSIEEGIAVFFTYEEDMIHPVVYSLSEQGNGEPVPTVSFDSEDAGILPYSFRIILPKSFEEKRSVVGKLIGLVERYKVGGFGYDIIYI